MDSEEDRAGSADSDNGGSSDNSNGYVQVSKDDIPRESSLEADPMEKLAAQEDSEEQGDEAAEGERKDPLTTSDFMAKPSDDPFYMESHDPLEDKESSPLTGTPAPPTQPGGGVEEVPTASSELTAPKATGLLSFLNVLHPSILYLMYWKDKKMSAIVLGMELVVLLTLTLNTFIHTTVLVLHSFMVVSLTYIIIKIAIASFYNREIRNPFSDYLSRKVTLPEDKIKEWTMYAVRKLNCYFSLLVRLLLYDNYRQSFKFGVFLWFLSFFTNCFTLIGALFLVVTLSFTVPPIYSKYQTKIDRFLEDTCSKVAVAIQSVGKRIPYLNKPKSD